MILVVSHSGDDHALRVCSVLERAAYPTLMVDTADFPVRMSVSQRFDGGQAKFEACIGGRTVDLAQSRAAWWRRPQPFTLHPGIAESAASFAYTECHEAIAGLWGSLGLRWVNPPELDERAHHKPYQLAVAAQVGLPIPRTLITNDPAAARDFARTVGFEKTVYKTFLASEEHWRETRILREDELGMLDQVSLAPVIFQEYVPAEADLRVTVVGGELFAAAITPAPGGYSVDYRMDLAGAMFAPTRLPEGTAEGIRALMERLGLVYGAVDLRRTPEGEHVFLEVNPAGEWLFVEERTRQPITRSFAQLLMQMDQGDCC